MMPSAPDVVVQNERMDGYTNRSYGDAFADVYDHWYENLGDLDETVATLADLATRARSNTTDSIRVLELGVGTGRIALPLAERLAEQFGERLGEHLGEAQVHGIDTSDKMLAVLAAKDRGGRVTTHVGDMTTDLPAGPFDLIFVAYNTLFNLPTEHDQQHCLAACAAALGPSANLLIEAFVPRGSSADGNADSQSTVSVKHLDAERVVLSVSTTDPDGQRAEGQFIEFTESGGVRLRPWSIRWSTPEQLDQLADAAGLVLVDRWGSFGRMPFDATSDRHVSCYRLRDEQIATRPHRDG